MQYAELAWDKSPEANAVFRKQLAPIMLVTYNRLEHTQRVVEALKCNMYAEDSDLIVYSDAAKNENNVEKVATVREYLHTITGFKSVTIIERTENQGVDKNGILGVTELVNKFGKVIVVEDDIITSKYFLKYMNDALSIYKEHQEVMQIIGYQDPISPDNLKKLPQVFFRHIECCWGWATWADRWQYYEKITKASLKAMSRKDIKRFDMFGNGTVWTVANGIAKNDMDDWSISWW